MKRWYLIIIVPLGLVVLIYLVGLNFSINFADIWSRDHQAKNTQRDVEKIPKINAVPKEVLRLRQEHQLAEWNIRFFNVQRRIAKCEAWQHILAGDS
jgi:hypothetical protein